MVLICSFSTHLVFPLSALTTQEQFLLLLMTNRRKGERGRDSTGGREDDRVNVSLLWNSSIPWVLSSSGIIVSFLSEI